MIQAAARAGTDAALYAAAIARWDNEGGASLGASHTHATSVTDKVVKFEQTTCMKRTQPTPIIREVTMAQAVSTSITRRSVVAGLALTAAPVTLAGKNKAYAQAQQPTAEKSDKSLYERLGGIFAIAAVVDHFSDAVVKNPIVGEKSKNPQLREWHTKNLDSLPEP